MYKNLLLLVISTLVSLAGLELALRVAMPERLAFVPTLKNNELTYEPNQFERARHIEWDYEVRINADGFRNDKILSELPDRTTLALGDSFTEGYGVALDAAYPKRLEQMLQTERPGAHVYNAGHYDTGLPTYRRVYRKIFKDVRAIDSVIIGVFIGNDMLRSATPPDGRLQLGNEFGEGWKYRLKVFLGSRVAIYAALNHVIKTNPFLYGVCKKFGACYAPLPHNIYAQKVINRVVPHSLKFIIALVDEIRADERNVLVLIVPTREQVDDDLWAKVIVEYGQEAHADRFSMNERLAAGLEAAGVDVLDLTDTVAAYQRDTGERLYFKYDGHWTAAGHTVAAEHVAAFIRRGWGRTANDPD